MKFVRIFKPSIDDTIEPNVIRGVLDTETLGNLKVDYSYQRERLGPAARKEIIKALELGRELPDIEVGMRGDHFSMQNAQSLELLDAAYIIDGYQRVESVKEHRERFPTSIIRLGAIIHINTTQAYERDRFQALNLFRTKVSPAVLLRNCKEQNHLMAQLYGMSKSSAAAVMYGRVCWSQNMAQGELIGAKTYCEVALMLHSHLGSFGRGSGTRDIPDALTRLEKIAGLPLFRHNVTAFWEFIEAIWGIRLVSRRGPAIHFKTTFLHTVTRILADHIDFWQGNRLVVPPEIRKKLARLPMNDPEIVRLASGSGKAVETLYYVMVTHINSGKRTKRLTNRYGNITPPMVMSEDEDERYAAEA